MKKNFYQKSLHFNLRISIFPEIYPAITFKVRRKLVVLPYFRPDKTSNLSHLDVLNHINVSASMVFLYEI